jgi:geranylgeranyl pyrophosphate synthase
VISREYARTMTPTATEPVASEQIAAYDLASADTPAPIARLRTAIDAALACAVRELPDHHEVFDYALSAGHRARPLACLLSCAAADGSWQDAMGAAVGIEFIHKASVARDDIADGDERRGGQEALHVRFGVPVALAASDVLWTAGVKRLTYATRPARQHQVLETSMQMLGEMALGQLEDVAPSATQRTVAARVLVNERKTGALTELACRAGAIVASAPATTTDALAKYGRNVGTAFQVVNDVRNVQGREADRPVASDIRAGRDTVVTAVARSPQGAVTPILGPHDGEDSATRLHAEVLASGSVARCQALAAELLADARRELAILPASPAREILGSLARGELFEIYAF